METSELHQIIKRGRNCDSNTAEEFMDKHGETIAYYADMGFSAQYIYDVINNENEL